MTAFEIGDTVTPSDPKSKFHGEPFTITAINRESWGVSISAVHDWRSCPFDGGRPRTSHMAPEGFIHYHGSY